MLSKTFLDLLICPVCKTGLQQVDEKLICHGSLHEYRIIDDIPVFDANVAKSWDIKLAKEKWNKFYENVDWEKGYKRYESDNLPSIYKHLDVFTGAKFLEIGGGPSYLAFDVAKKADLVVVVDFDLDILRVAKSFFQKLNVTAYFLCSNVNDMPIKNDVFDCSAGLGVIEHTQQIQKTVSELYRVTKPGGYTFQTVPYFSIFTLLRSSIRFGSYTPYSFINKIVNLIHIKLLNCRFMKYGYEILISKRQLKNLFKQVNFDLCEVAFYDYGQTLLRKSKLIGNIFYHVIRSRILGHNLFADTIFIKAYKDNSV